VAEVNKINQLAISGFLNKVKITLTAIEDGADAVGKVKAGNDEFDLILNS